MPIRFRLIVMNFLEFFVWGSWLITIGAYWFNYKNWSGESFGAIFSTMGISSLFMPMNTRSARASVKAETAEKKDS